MQVEKEQSPLKTLRKKLKVKPKDLDGFINAKGTSTKYYLEEAFHKNKMFRYLLYLKLKGGDLDEFFEEHIKENKIIIPKE